MLALPAGTTLPIAGEIVEATTRGGQTICLALKPDGELAAFQARCPHRGVPLCHGVFNGDQLICLEHLWRWHINSGKAVRGGHADLLCYGVQATMDEIRLLPP